MTITGAGGLASLRAAPDDFAPDVMAAIDATLEAVEPEHDATILLAIESGSRAWGFPSPDSDYDVRFIYVRRQADYLSLWPKRDVIETPLVGDLDINGWDLSKALKLMLKGNAVVLEWLRSPIVYRGDAVFRADLLALAHAHANRDAIACHYLHLGERQQRTYFGDGKHVALKKLFYALRPAAGLRWLRLYPDEAVPPMHFPTLVTECGPPADVAALTIALIARKAVTRELGEGPLPDVIAAFVEVEFAEAVRAFPEVVRTSRNPKNDADAFFVRWIG